MKHLTRRCLETCDPQSAKLLHLDHRMGSIKNGKDADIVLWTANPLSVYTKLRKHMWMEN